VVVVGLGVLRCGWWCFFGGQVLVWFVCGGGRGGCMAAWMGCGGVAGVRVAGVLGGLVVLRALVGVFGLGGFGYGG